LPQKVPATPDKMTKESLNSLLADRAFMDVLIERHFIGKVWGKVSLTDWVKAGPKNREFQVWLMSSAAVMDDVMLTRTPSALLARIDDSWDISAEALSNWRKIYYAYPESREGLYLRLAIATALRPPGTGSGIYEMTARASVINWNQKLYVRSFGSMYTPKSATASDVFGGNVKDLGPQMAIDSNLATRWAVNHGKDKSWLELDLGRPRPVSKVMIDERSWDRVSKYVVEYKVGNEWEMLFEGDNLGYFKKAFPPVTAQHVRLRTLDTRGQTGGPTIWEFSVGDVFDGNGWIEPKWSSELAGRWQTTKPIDIRLAKGAQTIWLCAPYQRGLALRWFELRPKDRAP
jgi:hypothetical protein